MTPRLSWDLIRANFTPSCVRAFRTLIQTLIATFSTTLLLDVNWVVLVNVSATATVLSFLGGLVSDLPEVPEAAYTHPDERGGR